MHTTIRLILVLVGNSLQRIAAGASGVLVGLYLAQLANRGSPIGAGLVGVLGAVSFGAELIAGATQLFGMTGLVSIFFAGSKASVQRPWRLHCLPTSPM